jgi:hypothetical protein
MQTGLNLLVLTHKSSLGKARRSRFAAAIGGEPGVDVKRCIGLPVGVKARISNMKKKLQRSEAFSRGGGDQAAVPSFSDKQSKPNLL